MLGIAIEGISVRFSVAVQPFFLSARRVQIQRRETIFLIIKDISLAGISVLQRKTNQKEKRCKGTHPEGELPLTISCGNLRRIAPDSYKAEQEKKSKHSKKPQVVWRAKQNTPFHDSVVESMLISPEARQVYCELCSDRDGGGWSTKHHN